MHILLLFAMIIGSGNDNISGYYLSGETYPGGVVEAYEKASKKPENDIVVTLDLPLYVFGELLDESMYEIEDKILYDSLTVFLKEILSMNRRYKYTKCRRAKESALLLDAYLKVPLYFLTGDNTLLQRKEIKEEVELIKNASEIATSPIFKIKEDYSQYKPRSHYTRTKRMRNYFRAMMYLGRMGFFPLSTEAPDLQSQNMGAAIILSKIITQNPRIRSKYRFISGIINSIVGKSDDYTPLEFLKIVKGYNVIPDNAICSEEFDSKIIEGLKEEKKPGIFSTLVRDTDTPLVSQIAIKLFGQRWILDSYVFQNLVYDKVGTKSKPRLLPRGLDLQAVLGSERAMDILIDEYKEDRYKNYLSQMESLQRLIQEKGDSIFDLSLYHMLLGIERNYIKARKNSPIFTYDEKKYEDKKLITNLGTWALLKHSTLLYGKQSYTVGITSVGPGLEKKTLTLVEPYPDIIGDIRSLNAKLMKLAKNLDVYENIKELDNLLTLMLKIALMEENGIPSQKAMNELRFFLKHNNLLRKEDKNLDVPLKVADVHTDPNSKKVLEVATGFPFRITYILTDGRKADGFIMSYYEFSNSMENRLSDREWEKLLKEKKIAPPVWIKKLFIKKVPQSRDF